MTENLLPIRDVAAQIGLSDDELLYYGPHTAKVKLDLLTDETRPPRGKLIMVTAITPTTYGEGKTVTSIGLAQGIARLGKKVLVTSREPSLGPVFGLKGGATGAGRAQIYPAERINLHFTGDFHAITTAHNLLAASLDAHIHHGNQLRLDVGNISWPRAMDMNDRALRQIVVGLGGKSNGVPREAGFVITAASEIMAIMALASSNADLRQRLDNILLGFNLEGQPVHARELGVTGALMVLLSEAIMPNLVQTGENTPAFVHCGPFANIAHGTSSVISQQIALRLADYVVNESGFGADLGAQKYLDLVGPSCGLKPSVAVVVATAKALAAHGLSLDKTLGPEAIQRGLCNLQRHLENLRKYNLPTVVAINRFPQDTDEELAVIRDFCEAQGVPFALSEGFAKGGAGMVDLAEKVIALADATNLNDIRSIHTPDAPVKEKIQTIAREIYRAAKVEFTPEATRKLNKFNKNGFGNYPVCIAKTQYSFSDNAKLLGAPEGFTLNITDVRLAAGAGFIVALAGSIMLMPGLPKVPQAVKMDVDENGQMIGVC